MFAAQGVPLLASSAVLLLFEEYGLKMAAKFALNFIDALHGICELNGLASACSKAVAIASSHFMLPIRPI